MKKLPLILLAGLLTSGTAQATSFINIFNGSLSDWNTAGTVVDTLADTPSGADTAFTLLGLSGLAATDSQWIDVTIQEANTGTPDALYNVVFTPNVLSIASPFYATAGYVGGLSSIGYQIATTGTDLLSSVRLDVNAAGVNGLESNITRLSDVSLANTAFLTLTSLGGQPNPLSPAGSHLLFSPRSTLFISDSFNANGGLINSVSNQFNVTEVPTPTTLLLMGLGLIVFGFISKKRNMHSSSQVMFA